jgi:FAD/FMN-containing dehydrogenase
VTLTNFGGNITFEPNAIVAPRTERDVLQCLDRFRDGKIRAMGGLHAWSAAAVCHDVVIDLGHLRHLALERSESGHVEVEIGAGCTIDEVLDFLHARGGYTLPTFGMTGRQTVAGAIATATHGAGRASLSHYVRAARVAAYDSAGVARTYEWSDGDALRAIRCGVGCAGIVLSVRMRVQADYLIDERTEWFDRIEQVLGTDGAHTLQQCYLVPWTWRWFAQLRTPVEAGAGPAPGGMARLVRLFRFAGVDALFNGVVRLLSGTFEWDAAIRAWYRHAFPAYARRGLHVVDWCRHVLMMRHDLYRHVEMELFVPASRVVEAAAFVEWLLRQCGGESSPPPVSLDPGLEGRVAADVAALRGRYVHDHPILFRKVLRDDALVSMTSGDEAAWYAISFITYRRHLDAFQEMAGVAARAMTEAYGARPHWGKLCPLDAERLAPLYPDLDRFRAHCAAVDPRRVFVNDFAARCLGL